MSGPHPAPSPVDLVLGVDPDPREPLSFQDALEAHARLLETPEVRGRVRWLKPNLSFFLARGARGIEALEGFVERVKPHYRVLVDAKFSEIENSLRASLRFVFEGLGAHGVTLNPFLGEGSIRLALETCLAHAGPEGRVHVLCRTTESSGGALAGLQAPWEVLAETVARLGREVAGTGSGASHDGQAGVGVAGVVVGAGHEALLSSSLLARSGLSVLAPGLGAQGASFAIVERLASLARSPGAAPREVLFPLSRAIFEGGRIAPEEMLARFVATLEKFPPVVRKEAAP